MMTSANNRRLLFTQLIVTLLLILYIPVRVSAEMPDRISGLYLPPQVLTTRKFQEIRHYYTVSGMNAVVIHVKDPTGNLYWDSENPLAKEIGALSSPHSVKRAVHYFKSYGIWTIAKLDVFQDTKLASEKPGYAVLDSRTGTPWNDNSDLLWTNPYNTEVWDYIISLCRELVAIGFDEIQFDYIRFPSDGKLSVIQYPDKPDDQTMSQCIGEFMKQAWTELKPLEVTLSADIFGLTAWKKDDFGVGQVIELMAPYTDVLCPMFYPSHFPEGFLGFKTPSDHPETLMRLSVKAITRRTHKKIRPWVQGFWYSPDEISSQLDGITGQNISGWMVWNSSGHYKTTYSCLSKRASKPFPPPVFYPDIAHLRTLNNKIVKGNSIVVNHTDYLKGISVLSLESPTTDGTGKFSAPIAVINTLDEAILDIVLKHHGYRFGRLKPKYPKSTIVTDIMCRELHLNPRKIQPKPIYLIWGQTVPVFTTKKPESLQPHFRSTN